MDDAISAARLAVDAAMAMLIWLVQLVIYPAFHAIERDNFIQWHHGYARTLAFIVIPPMLAQAALAGYQGFCHPTPANLLSLAAIATAWIATFTLSVPCHAKLQADGKQTETIEKLVATNWIRTVAWSVALIAGGA